MTTGVLDGHGSVTKTRSAPDELPEVAAAFALKWYVVPQVSPAIGAENGPVADTVPAGTDDPYAAVSP